MNEFDFTTCPRVPGRAYNGANGKKIAVMIEGAVWILKFPPSAADKPNELSYTFPGSMLKIGGRKINYRDFIAARGEPELIEALGRLMPKIKDLDFGRLINDTPYLSDLQSEFLIRYLELRREHIFC